MYFIQPSYYSEFSCLASDCPDTCCKGWVVEIDPTAKEVWERISRDSTCMPLPGGCIPAEHIDVVARGGSQPRYQLRMDETMHCPMLSSEGLCNLVIACGEECITQICRQFPRMETKEESICQRYLSVRCPAVLDLLWESEHFHYQLSEHVEAAEVRYPMRDLLDQALSMGADAAAPEEYLMALFRLFVKLHKEANTEGIEYGEAEILSDHEWMERISADYLDSPVFGPDFAERLRQSRETGYPRTKVRFLQEGHQHKLKLLIMEELFSSILTVDAEDFDTVLVRFQWLIIQYLVIRRWLYLDYDQGIVIDDEKLKYCISRVFRITDHADIIKLSFLDPAFRNWMWSLQTVEQMLYLS